MLTNLRNRILVLLGCLMLLFGIFPVVADAAEAYGGVCGDNLQWHFSTSGKLTIIGSGAMYDYDDDVAPWIHYTEQITSLELPEGLTAIGYRAFAYTAIRSVCVPDSVTSIGDNAFYICSELTSITIPDSVTSIGDNAFADCPNLNEVHITDLNAWCRIAFGSPEANPMCYADNLYINGTEATNIVLDESVTAIPDYAFWNCANLTSITIPDSVTSIGCGAFVGCAGLTSITIPDSVTSIEDSAFSNCTGLTSVIMPDSITTIGDFAFCDCSGLTSINIPDSVTSIGEQAFAYCTSLTSVTIPDSITYIGYRAFGDCPIKKLIIADGSETITSMMVISEDTLLEVVIPDSVTSIEDSAFSNCTGLTSVTIPNSVTAVGDSAFYNCDNLTSVTIGNSVKSIGDSAFSFCINLTSVTIPNSVTSIGGDAFSQCRSLTSVSIGNSVTSIGDSAFEDCTGLTSITIPNSVTSIDRYAFYKCTGLTSLTISDSVTNIGDDAFSVCPIKKLIIADGSKTVTSTMTLQRSTVAQDSVEEVVIPDSVTSIGDHAFYFYTSLTSITIPDGVTSIGDSAFYGCSGLTSLTIPNSVTSIGDSAFCRCSNLNEVHITDLSAWCRIAFGNDFANPMYYAGRLYIDGLEATNIVLDESVTAISDYAFYNCTSLASITIPNSITSIGKYAFDGCTNLTTVIYCGTKEQWNAVKVLDYDYDWARPTNTSLIQATKRFHNFENGVCTICGNTALYTVTFKNWDDTVISTKTYLYGDKVIVPTTPTKAADKTYTYTFDGWDSAVVDCAGDATYTATYKSDYIDYTVTFKDWDGTVISTKTYHYGDNVSVPMNPTRAEDKKYWYSFKGWDNVVVDCAGDATYTAIYSSSAIQYNVTFVDWDGTVLSNRIYYYGNEVTVPAIPLKEADQNFTYTFNGWDKTVVDCDGNATYTATYKPEYINYTVTFMNWDGAVISAKTYHYGDRVTVPADPIRAADEIYTYSFNGWDSTVMDCTGDATYTATYESKYIDYTVTFKDWDGTVLSSKTYHYGDKVTAPADPIRAADEACTYSFNGWDNLVVDCVGDATYTATYMSEYISYTVTFRDWDGAMLTDSTYRYGDAVFGPPECYRNADNTYTYTFVGWDKEVVDCAGDATYTATYTATYINYTITFQYSDGTVISKHTYHYSDEVSVPSDPEAPEGLGAGYAFDGWDKEITPCQGDAVYTAQFIRVFIPGDLDQDEQVNNKDVEYLLWHTLFPEQYPIVGDADFNGDGTINNKDVEYLLWHTLFPEDYPLIPKKKED